MTTYFLDSNTIVKYYIEEPGSNWVRSFIDQQGNSCLICTISFVEVASALAQLQRGKRFGKRLMQLTFANFRRDVQRGFFFTHPIDTKTLELAAELAMRHLLKGFDATQVASAVLGEQLLGARVIFVSGDKQALNAALAEGMTVDNPFEHQ